MENAFRIRNWAKFQHYKDRNPPWIKLHYELMSSVDWVMADDQTKLLMVVCMMIASRHDGNVPNNPDYIQKMSHLNKKPDLVSLCNTGFFEDASIALADCKHDASECLRSVSVSVSDSDSSLSLEGDYKGKHPVSAQKLGELGNVLLTNEDYEKLKSKHPAAELAMGIEILDAYLAQPRNSKRYKNHYAVLKETSWVWDRVKEKIVNQKPKMSDYEKRIADSERRYREAIS
jgi:hypothetical protein